MRVSTLHEWRESWLALPRAVRVVCKTILGLIGLLAAVLAIVLVLVTKCVDPADGARRGLVTAVRITEKQELARTGRLGDIDAELRSGREAHTILQYYRIVVQKTSNGYDVVIKPTGWCFCRPTFILHDGGNRLQER